MADETEWMDLQPYGGPDEGYVDLTATVEALTQWGKSLNYAFSSSAVKSLYEAFSKPSVTDSLVHTDKITLPRIQRNHGPRPRTTFDHTGRRRF